MRVLIVEKDHSVRDRVKVALQQFDGVSVDFAEDSWALELAKENEYDLLVITDRLEVPGDGLTLLKELRTGGLAAPALLLSRDRGDVSIARELPNVATVLTVPPDTVEIFKAIVTIQLRLSQKPAH